MKVSDSCSIPEGICLVLYFHFYNIKYITFLCQVAGGYANEILVVCTASLVNGWPLITGNQMYRLGGEEGR